MIFELHSSLVGFANASIKNRNDVIEKLELLWTAHREGNHIIFSEIDISEELIGIVGDESRSAKALLIRIINQYPKIAALAYHVERKVLVGDYNPLSMTMKSKVIEYPVGEINSSLLQKSLVLVENLTDAEFYHWVATNIYNQTPFESVNLSFEGYPGGGNTTAEAYENLKFKTSRLCLCIVDGDIRAPKLQYGETAAKVEKSDRLGPRAQADFHVIGACSIENLIPFNAFEMAWGDDPNYKQKLIDYKEHHRESHWRYLQLKKNISCFELHGPGAFAVYWRSALANTPSGCADKICSKKTECKHNMLAQLSGSPLGATFALVKDKFVNLDELVPDIRQAWEKIASELLSWCCAPNMSAAA